MLHIPCPWCGLREETEFHYGGQADIARPESPGELTDAEWADFLFMRNNTKGEFDERWMHAAGCRRWFNLRRHTVTHRIVATWRPGESPP